MSILVQLVVGSYGEIAARNKIDNLLLEKIDIDRAVDYLLENRQISAGDISVLKVVALGHSSNSGSKELGMSKWKFRKVFHRTCEKIEKFLGREYSDERFLQMLKSKYKITPDAKRLEDVVQGKS